MDLPTERHPASRVRRAPMRATTEKPWNAHCHVCCWRLLELDVEVAEILGAEGVPQSSWWFATVEEAWGFLFGGEDPGHLAEHVEATA